MEAKTSTSLPTMPYQRLQAYLCDKMTSLSTLSLWQVILISPSQTEIIVSAPEYSKLKIKPCGGISDELLFF